MTFACVARTNGGQGLIVPYAEQFGMEAAIGPRPLPDDAFTRECLTIRVRRKLNSTDVLDVLTDLFVLHGIPAHIRSDGGPEFVAKSVRNWIGTVGAMTAVIEPGSPWGENVKKSIQRIDFKSNGYCESFNSRFRNELLHGEIFYSLREAQIIIKDCRRHDNTRRPHSAPGYHPPAPESLVPTDHAPVMQ